MTGTASTGLPVRVMHLVYTLRSGGMEHGVVKIVNGLDPRLVASSICSTTPADSQMRALVRSSVPVFELKRRAGNDPLLVWRLFTLLRRERPDVLHTHAWGTLLEGLVAARLARVPLVVHGEHGTLQLRARQVRAQRWGWNHVDRVLSVSSRLAERMSKDVGIPCDRVHVIRNGVNLGRFGRVRRPVSRSGLRFGFVHDRCVVLGAVGRLVDVKDHARFIEAVHVLRSRGHDVAGVIAGDGPLRANLEDQVAKLGLEGSVRLLGHRTDIEAVFADLDVFVQPSKSEGMSNTVLEAMAAGLPVVATDVGGADEMVVDGQTGILVRACDTGALVAGLEQLLSGGPGRRDDMGRAARGRAQGEFSLQRMLHGYESFYTGLLPRSAGAGVTVNHECLG